jgi:hypothetical protein
MKGCYVYFTDREAGEYFRSRITPRKFETTERVSADQSRESSGAFEITTPVAEPFTRLPLDRVKPFENSVPLVDLKFAAGAFGPAQAFDVRDAEWVELPEHYRPVPGLFVARVVGESMNRRIPNGSWCLFKANPSGTKQGRVVVAQHRSIHDPEAGGSFTVKVYFSEKEVLPDGSWRHTRVVLRPDSDQSEFPEIVLEGVDAGSVVIVAELIGVLE